LAIAASVTQCVHSHHLQPPCCTRIVVNPLDCADAARCQTGASVLYSGNRGSTQAPWMARVTFGGAIASLRSPVAGLPMVHWNATH